MTHADYETIEEPILSESVLKEHQSIQMIISRIHHLKDTLIPDLESLKSYNQMFNKDNSRVDKELEEKSKELEDLEQQRKELKEKMKNGKQ